MTGRAAPWGVGLGVLALGMAASSAPPSKPPGPKPPGPKPPGPKPPGPVVPKGPFIDAWPQTFDDTARALLLGRAKSACGFDASWTIVRSEAGARLLEMRVHDDALSVEGVRLTSDYQTAQQIADLCGWLLLTPWLMGLMSAQTSHIPVTTMTPIYGSKQQMLTASAAIGKNRAAVGGAAIDNPGKAWVLTANAWKSGQNNMGLPYGKAAYNFGLFTAPWQPIQTLALKNTHSLSYTDYSQMLRYADRYATLHQEDQPARKVDLYELVHNPELAELVTGPKGAAKGKIAGEGPLPSYRHPGVALPT